MQRLTEGRSLRVVNCPYQAAGRKFPRKTVFEKERVKLLAPALSAFWHMLQSLLQLRLIAAARISKPVPAERWQSG